MQRNGGTVKQKEENIIIGPSKKMPYILILNLDKFDVANHIEFFASKNLGQT